MTRQQWSSEVNQAWKAGDRQRMQELQDMSAMASDMDVLVQTLRSIKQECSLHARGPHDKSGNMLSIGAWAAKALEKVGL